MLLVMLWSVTTWADSVKFSYLFKDNNPDIDESFQFASYVFETWKIRTNNNIKISLGTNATAHIQPQQNRGVVLRAEVNNFTVESLASTIIINSIKIKYCGGDYITKENSITFPNGTDNYQWGFDVFCYLEEVTVDYTDLHVHNYSGDWQMDATYHWHLCQGEGACNATVGDKSPHNYGESGAAYYTCSVCDYLNEARKEQYELPGYKQEKIDALTAQVANKSDDCKAIAQTYIGKINSATSKSAVSTQYNNAINDIMLQELKEEKIAAIEVLVEDVHSDIIANNVQTALAAIRAATTTSAVNTAYNNAVNQLQPLLNIYNDGKVGTVVQPTEPGMRLKVTKKDGNVYEFQTIDLESVEYYRAE